MLLALKRLENEGLVEIIPQVGCRVLGPSAQTLEELFSLRAALEGVAAEAARRGSTPPGWASSRPCWRSWTQPPSATTRGRPRSSTRASTSA